MTVSISRSSALKLWPRRVLSSWMTPSRLSSAPIIGTHRKERRLSDTMVLDTCKFGSSPTSSLKRPTPSPRARRTMVLL